MPTGVEGYTHSPRWPWLAAIALGLTQPAVHLYIQYFPPPGAVHSGMSIPDSAIFLQAMQMFQTGFHSPYASGGMADAGIALYPVAHLWLYGVLGLLADLLHIDHFLFLGIANGAALTFYLCMVWQFLRGVVPSLAAHAFALFTLSAGPAGLLLLIACMAGGFDVAGFEDGFFRWIVYGVTEGPYFHPLSIGPRAYYTLSLGIFFGALEAMHRGRHLRWLPLVVLASFIYARAGVFSTGIAALLIWHRPVSLWRVLYSYGLAVAAGAWGSAVLLRLNPAVVENHLQYTNQAMWISAAIAALLLHIPAIGSGIRAAWPEMSRMQQRLALGCMGYLALYVLLYLARALYYGQLWQGSDGAVAAAVSDFALPGLLLGALPLRRNGQGTSSSAMVVWALLLFALAISGFGQGWFLQLGPQRLQLFLWLPLCVLAAMGLTHWQEKSRRVMWSLFITAGAASLTVSLSVFQASAARSGAKGPYPRLFAQWISTSESAAIQHLRGSTVLALPPLADTAVRLGDAHAPWGAGAFNLSKTPWAVVKSDATGFFDPATSDILRRMRARAYHADFVLLGEVGESQALVVQQLDASRWLQRQPVPGNARLYKVALE